MNPAGSSHGEQLQPKWLTLLSRWSWTPRSVWSEAPWGSSPASPSSAGSRSPTLSPGPSLGSSSPKWERLVWGFHPEERRIKATAVSKYKCFVQCQIYRLWSVNAATSAFRISLCSWSKIIGLKKYSVCLPMVCVARAKNATNQQCSQRSKKTGNTYMYICGLLKALRKYIWWLWHYSATTTKQQIQWTISQTHFFLFFGQ